MARSESSVPTASREPSGEKLKAFTESWMKPGVFMQANRSMVGRSSEYLGVEGAENNVFVHMHVAIGRDDSRFS